ncbi:MAG: hypothetical protein IJP37_00115, partial [Clostridia bacterium]|nr:hypothetical protein [Clostridia bacterium]
RSPEKQSIRWMLCPGRVANAANVRSAERKHMQNERRIPLGAPTKNRSQKGSVFCCEFLDKGIRSPEKQSIRWMLCPGRVANAAKVRSAERKHMQNERRIPLGAPNKEAGFMPAFLFAVSFGGKNPR